MWLTGKKVRIMQDFDNIESIWDRLKREKLPIVLYGMGDGADKILGMCHQHGIAVAGVFASDEFVRGQQYQGFTVLSLEQMEAALGDFVILLCFASQRPEVLRRVRYLSSRHTLLAPDVPVYGEALFTHRLLRRYSRELESLRGLLADEQSHKVLNSVIQYKLSGDLVLLSDCQTPRDEVYQKIFRLGCDEVFVDAGAYTGDTVEEFVLHARRGFHQILALEPDRRNFKKLCATVDRLGIQAKTKCLPTGVWSCRDTLCFNHRSGRQAAFSGGGIPDTPVDSIDNLLDGELATLLKFDVEGAEEEALQGSQYTIARYRPRLAVSVYHRSEDIFVLPNLIHRMCPDYKLYLRHHPYFPAWETNCYATI